MIGALHFRQSPVKRVAIFISELTAIVFLSKEKKVERTWFANPFYLSFVSSAHPLKLARNESVQDGRDLSVESYRCEVVCAVLTHDTELVRRHRY